MMQSHIHLSLDDGSSDIYNAPPHTWRATQANPTPQVTSSLVTGLTGKIFPNVLRNDAGIVRTTLWKINLAVKAEGPYTLNQRKNQVIALLGNVAYFVPPEHPGDTEDHAPYVKTVFVQDVGEFEPINIAHERYYVEVILLEGDIHVDS